VTFSRGGFLGLIIGGGLLLWNLRRSHRKLAKAVPALALGVLLLALPTEYGGRLYTIFKPEQDRTTSAQLRMEVLQRAVGVAARHAIVGIGMGNFTLHSIKDMRAHNAYLEIMADLGVPGLIVYLILMIAPVRRLRRLQAEVAGGRDPNLELAAGEREVYYLGVALQSAIVAYMVCSFFLSIQYSWYVYYPVAFAVALRHIYRADRAVRVAEAESETGAIWKPYGL
jgi:O-antigen ligase